MHMCADACSGCTGTCVWACRTGPASMPGLPCSPLPHLHATDVMCCCCRTKGLQVVHLASGGKSWSHTSQCKEGGVASLRTSAWRISDATNLLKRRATARTSCASDEGLRRAVQYKSAAMQCGHTLIIDAPCLMISRYLLIYLIYALCILRSGCRIQKCAHQFSCLCTALADDLPSLLF